MYPADLRSNNLYVTLYVHWMYFFICYLFPFLALVIFNVAIYRRVSKIIFFLYCNLKMRKNLIPNTFISIESCKFNMFKKKILLTVIIKFSKIFIQHIVYFIFFMNIISESKQFKKNEFLQLIFLLTNLIKYGMCFNKRYNFFL